MKSSRIADARLRPEIDLPWWVKELEQGGLCDRNLPDARGED
jgi:hypothetical protein